MDRAFKKLPALALAGTMACAAFSQAAAREIPAAQSGHLPMAGRAYLAFPVNAKPQNIGERFPAYNDYCKRYADDCIDAARKDQVITVTEETWAKLTRIFDEVRKRMTIVQDGRKYPLTGIKDARGNDVSPDVWTRGEDGKGDCEDWMLRWQFAFIHAGFPDSALLKTLLDTEELEIVRVKGKEYAFRQAHMVLAIRTDRGDFIADMLKDGIYPLSELEKKWTVDLVESPLNMTHFYTPQVRRMEHPLYATATPVLAR